MIAGESKIVNPNDKPSFAVWAIHAVMQLTAGRCTPSLFAFVRIPPLVNCRCRAAQLNLDTALHEVSNEFLVRIAGRHHYRPAPCLKCNGGGARKKCLTAELE
jgi:hypothetical protein